MAIKTQDVRYADGSVSCLGFLAYDDARSGKRPGVLVVHEAFGLGDHAMDRAKMLAGIGYAALAVDLYGDRKQATSQDDMAVTMGPLRENPAALRARAKAGLTALAGQSMVDSGKLFAIGFCFGGTTVLELA